MSYLFSCKNDVIIDEYLQEFAILYASKAINIKDFYSLISRFAN
jgi:hypothetical protein